MALNLNLTYVSLISHAHMVSAWGDNKVPLGLQVGAVTLRCSAISQMPRLLTGVDQVRFCISDIMSSYLWQLVWRRALSNRLHPGSRH